MIADWINSHLPWLVETIAGLGLKGNLILTAVILAAIVVGSTIKENRELITDLMNDDDPFDSKWMDYDAWLETRPERKK